MGGLFAGGDGVRSSNALNLHPQLFQIIDLIEIGRPKWIVELVNLFCTCLFSTRPQRE